MTEQRKRIMAKFLLPFTGKRKSDKVKTTLWVAVILALSIIAKL
jgi:hypothetical protein